MIDSPETLTRTKGLGKRLKKFFAKWSGVSFIRKVLKETILKRSATASVAESPCKCTKDDSSSFFQHEEDLNVLVQHLTIAFDPPTSGSTSIQTSDNDRQQYAFLEQNSATIVEQLLAFSTLEHSYESMDDYKSIYTCRKASESGSNASSSIQLTMIDLEAAEMSKTASKPTFGLISRGYRFQRTIGKGSFSKVKLAIDMTTMCPVAIKMIHCSVVQKDARLQRILAREIAILHHVHHPNIVRFEEVAVMGRWICLVMEWICGGELFDYVSERRRLSEAETRSILRQLLDAISYLHSVGVVHRDLKLENVLIEPGRGDRKVPRVKLIDFGLARFCDSSRMVTRCGSEEYAAPEVLRGKPYDATISDAWSFGIIMYACLVGSLPFNPDPSGSATLAEKIVSGSYLIPEGIMSKNAHNLIKSLLNVDPQERLTVNKAMEHVWFSTKED